MSISQYESLSTVDEEPKTPTKIASVFGMNRSIRNSFTSRKRQVNLQNSRVFKLMELAKLQTETQIKEMEKKSRDVPVLRNVLQHWQDGRLKYFISWVIWLLVGAIFYANVNFNGDYMKGFYYSVNVGYSIGWGVFHDNSTRCKIFSIFHLTFGALFASKWLASVLESTIDEKDNAYEKYIIYRNLSRHNPFVRFPTLSQLYVWVTLHSSNLFVIYMWVVYVCFGAAWSCQMIGWSPIDGFYFSISSLSTGGLWGVPSDSPSRDFLIVGLFAATGVPLMGMAMANLAALIVEQREFAKLMLREQLSSIDMGEKEQYLLDVFRHDKSRQFIDKNEYLLFSLIKRKKVDIALVHEIYEEFDRLDVNSTGMLTVQDIEERARLREAESHDLEEGLGVEHSPVLTEKLAMNSNPNKLSPQRNAKRDRKHPSSVLGDIEMNPMHHEEDVLSEVLASPSTVSSGAGTGQRTSASTFVPFL